MKTAFVYSGRFGSFGYGGSHPMRPVRLRLTYELIESLGLAGLECMRLVEAREATLEELRLFHTHEYLETLKRANTGMIPVDGPSFGLGYGDNPVFEGVYDWSRLCTGASVQAAELVASGEVDVAFNIGGGLHHAMPSRASGFCYINDPAVAIKRLVAMGKRVAYVDLDAHHGDGVEYAFYETPRVLTISIHESGQYLFPGTGASADIGIRQGRGYSINLPLPPGAGDAAFVRGFEAVVPAFVRAFSPDVLVTQLGVDTFERDPITHLNLTTNGFETMLEGLRSLGVPWVALGGGGYDLGTVARAWTLAWAAMNGVEVRGEMPAEFISKNRDIFDDQSLRDPVPDGFALSRADDELLSREIEYLRREVLPMVSGV